MVLGNQQWPDVKLHLDKIAAAVKAAIAGSYFEIEILRNGDDDFQLGLSALRNWIALGTYMAPGFRNSGRRPWYAK